MKEVGSNKNAPTNDTCARQYIFDGISFIGPAVSKDEYVKHYEEYLARTSEFKTGESEDLHFDFHSKPTD